MAYPFRIPRKGKPKSSEKNTSKRKSWMSDGTVIERNMGTPSKPVIVRTQIKHNKSWDRTEASIANKKRRALSRFQILPERQWALRAGLWPDSSYEAYRARKEAELARLRG